MSPKVDQVLKAYAKGKASRRELADVLKAESTSVRFESLLEYFRRLWPEAKLWIRRGRAPVMRICPSQSQLNVHKHRLVAVLFDSIEQFDRVNHDFFQEYPVSALSLHDGRFAVLDGHHRVRRWWELAGDERPMRLTVLGTHNVELLGNYGRQVETIHQMIGSSHIKDVPVV